jgi:hypothetical protein
MASINNMVKKCSGLIDTRDVSDWENRFLKNVKQLTNDGDNTSGLSENQVGASKKSTRSTSPIENRPSRAACSKARQ